MDNHPHALIMENDNRDQALLSEQLLLLDKLGFPASGASRDHVDNPDTKLLDIIALLLTTGLPNDRYAVAFDKRQGFEVVLAKNGTPNEDDIADARELFSSLCSPEIRVAKDLYPFVVRRCRANVVKRVQKLRASIFETGFYEDFCSRLDQWSSANDPLSPSAFKLEFPRGANSIVKHHSGTPLSATLRHILDGIIRNLAVSEVPKLEELMTIHFLVSVLAESRFLQLWVMREHAGYEKVKRFQRCTDKLSRYFDDVPYLLRSAKRLEGPIKHRWVTDESLGIQVGAEPDEVHIHAETTQEAIRRVFTVSSRLFASMKERQPSMFGPWERTVHTCLHAELRIILYFGDVFVLGNARFQTMGLSKPSCLCCALWMAEHNLRCGINWKTRSRYKPDASWAFTTRAQYSNMRDPELRGIDERLASQVFRHLIIHLQDAAGYFA